MSWIKGILNKITVISSERAAIPEGLWTKCQLCERVLYREELARNFEVCPHCDHHMLWSARCRLLNFLDGSNFDEIGGDIEPKDILKFRDSKKYKDRISIAQKTTGEMEALVAMRGELFDIPVVAAAFEFSFIGGSMSSAVGRRFVAAALRALADNVPLICFSASGGARMQEGLLSLMQMAKTSAVLAKLREARVPYISVLTNPTMGGVSASLAMLGDINIAEPHALIGFTGPRVIQQTVREALPPGFQKSEFLLKKGAIDMIVHRSELRRKVASILAKLLHRPPPTKTNSF